MEAQFANAAKNNIAQLFVKISPSAQETPPTKKKRKKRNPKRIQWRDRQQPGWRERRERLLQERETQARFLADCRDGL